MDKYPGYEVSAVFNKFLKALTYLTKELKGRGFVSNELSSDGVTRSYVVRIKEE